MGAHGHAGTRDVALLDRRYDRLMLGVGMMIVSRRTAAKVSISESSIVLWVDVAMVRCRRLSQSSY